MASNDTNSWDDTPDERLRRRWQQTFADHEVQPGASLNRRVLSQLPTSRRRRPTGWLVSAVLLLLLSIGLVYTNRVGETIRLERTKSMSVRRNAPGQSVAVSQKGSGRAVLPRLPIAPLRTNSSPDAKPSVIAEKTIIKTTASRVPTGQQVARSQTTTRTPALLVPTRQRVSRPSPSAHAYTAIPPVAGDERAFTEQFTSANQPTTSASIIPTEQSIEGVSSTVWTLLDSRKITFNHFGRLPGQLPAGEPGVTHPLTISSVRQRWQWFVDVLPTSSFQLMSVPSASMDYLSQVGSPAAFSPATWGYQVNGGVRFRHWRAYLTAGQLRRWAYYTVNENRYRLKASPADPYQLVRDTYTVSENVALPMLGVGLSQERLLAKGRYAVEAGGQASYLPTTNQTFVGLRGSIGRRWPISRTLEMQAGPTVEYGLTRLLNEQQQLAIHPFVLGIGIRLQPRSGQ